MLEILEDERLKEYISNSVGKKLAVINAGAQVTTPSATITLNGGECTRASNTKQEVSYKISFALPFFGANAYDKCLDFLDFLIPIFFDYRTRTEFIKSASPSLVEQNNDIKTWIININVIVEVFV
ncbi:MAG: hypothetical protein IJ859_10685 [Synergistaceae bacterium]|nr:hypothetical protein [Synergistaceae bacterium]MBR2209261.1 hypothetical protein [Synergistaceae bacterium]